MQYSRYGSHKRRAEDKIDLPLPPGHAAFGAVQDTISFLIYKCTFLVHVNPLIQHFKFIFSTISLNPFSVHPLILVRISPIQVQNLSGGLVELHKLHTSPPVKLVKVTWIPFFLSRVSAAPHALMSQQTC